MRDKITNIRKSITSIFGVVGILSGIYWALLNASVGLAGLWCGKTMLDKVNDIMSVINVVIPYVVLVVCVSAGIFWLVSWIYELVMRHKDEKQLKSVSR